MLMMGAKGFQPHGKAMFLQKSFTLKENYSKKSFSSKGDITLKRFLASNLVLLSLSLSLSFFASFFLHH